MLDPFSIEKAECPQGSLRPRALEVVKGWNAQVGHFRLQTCHSFSPWLPYLEQINGRHARAKQPTITTAAAKSIVIVVVCVLPLLESSKSNSPPPPWDQWNGRRVSILTLGKEVGRGGRRGGLIWILCGRRTGAARPVRRC